MVRVVQTPWLLEVATIVNRPGEQLHVDTTMPAPSGIGDEFVGISEGTPLHVVGTVDALLDGLITTLQITATVHAQCSRCLEDLSGEQSFNLTAFFPYAFTLKDQDINTTHKATSTRQTSITPADHELADHLPADNTLANDRLVNDTRVHASNKTSLSHKTARNNTLETQSNTLENELGDVYPLLAQGVAIDLEAPLRDMFIDQLDEQPLCSPECQGLCPTCGVRNEPDHHHETHDPRFDVLRNWKSS